PAPLVRSIVGAMQPKGSGGSPYDEMAESYAASSGVNPMSAHYERPGTIALLGDVTGAHVLEAGCGPGILTEWLVAHGAGVVAFDASAEMVRLARERNGSTARIELADLAQPLTFAPDATFDIVVASLVLHYVEDWTAALREFNRVLNPAGKVVLSTHHPTKDWRAHSPDDYFRVMEVNVVWMDGDRPVLVTFWRRPLTAMAESIAAA